MSETGRKMNTLEGRPEEIRKLRPEIDNKIKDDIYKDELLDKIRFGEKDIAPRTKIDEPTEEELRMEMEARLEKFIPAEFGRYFEQLKQEVLNDLSIGHKYISARRMRMLAKALESKIEKDQMAGDKTQLDGFKNRLARVLKFMKEEMGE